ncbi:MAG: SWIM zinc finger family protein [Chloroflexota bacterium]
MPRNSEFASTWWAQRWIRLLERFGWSARLNRGRSYARQGNVLDIDVQPGLVRAKVQGSRKQPYRVEIGLKPLSRQEWNKVIGLLRRKAIYAARLLSGEMPRDIEEIFKAAEVPLFPQSGDDLLMSCTCPDWANPCKHVAAAYYVLGSEFDRDPFLLFQLRGRSKEQVMASLRGTRPERAPTHRAPRVASEPLENHLSDFWEAGEELDDISIRVTPPPVPQAILKRLGPVPLHDIPEEWNADLARMFEVVSKDALAFVHVPGAAAARVPAINQNGSNGTSPDGGSTLV